MISDGSSSSISYNILNGTLLYSEIENKGKSFVRSSSKSLDSSISTFSFFFEVFDYGLTYKFEVGLYEAGLKIFGISLSVSVITIFTNYCSR